MSQLMMFYKSIKESTSNAVNKLVPTLEDLSIDENLSELQRITKYINSSIGLRRLVHVKMLGRYVSSYVFYISSLF